MPCGDDRSRDHAFVQLRWRVDAGDRKSSHRGRGRLNRIEVRLDVDDRIVFVAAVVEPTKPELIREITVGQRGERGDHAHEKQHEGQANPHLRLLATRLV
jgi:hypothetical protein